MKPFLGIDLTKDKKNTQYNGKEFLVLESSPTMCEQFDTLSLHVSKADKKYSNIFFNVVRYVLVFSILNAIVRLNITADEINLIKSYQNAPWAFWLIGICFIIFLAVKIFKYKKTKNMPENAESQYIISNLKELSDKLYSQLGVPTEAQMADILVFNYKIKNNVPIAVTKGLELTPYTNLDYKIFTDDNNLYLADVYGKYCFPLSSLRSIHKINKRISIPGWNKEEKMTSEKYRQYKLKANNYGIISIDVYYILEFEHNGEIYGIYFPNYELFTFKKLLPNISVDNMKT